jgi:hypothetical protein
VPGLRRSHAARLWSRLPDSTMLPSADTSTHVTISACVVDAKSFCCTPIVATAVGPERMSHSFTVKSREPGWEVHSTVTSSQSAFR